MVLKRRTTRTRMSKRLAARSRRRSDSQPSSWPKRKRLERRRKKSLRRSKPPKRRLTARKSVSSKRRTASFASRPRGNAAPLKRPNWRTSSAAKPKRRKRSLPRTSSGRILLTRRGGTTAKRTSVA